MRERLQRRAFRYWFGSWLVPCWAADTSVTQELPHLSPRQARRINADELGAGLPPRWTLGSPRYTAPYAIHAIAGVPRGSKSDLIHFRGSLELRASVGAAPILGGARSIYGLARRDASVVPQSQLLRLSGEFSHRLLAGFLRRFPALYQIGIPHLVVFAGTVSRQVPKCVTQLPLLKTRIGY